MTVQSIRRQKSAGIAVSVCAIILMATLPALASGGMPEAGQQADTSDERIDAQTTNDQDEQNKPVNQNASPPVEEFIYVEGSLPYVPQTNTIISKLPLALEDIPANVGTVTSFLIEEQYGRVLSEALVNVSNINPQPGFGVFDFFAIRGFDSLSSGLILTDGAPEPESTLYQMYNIELVEVLKGPGGFLYGSNPLAGAVNLVRKQPLPTSFLDLSADVGSYGNLDGSFDWNYGTGDVAFRLNGMVRDQGSHRDAKESTTYAINPSFQINLNDDSQLNVNIEYLDASFIPDSGIPVLGDVAADVPREANYQPANDMSDQQVVRFQLDYQTRVNEWLEVRNKFYRRDLDWFSAGTIYNGVFPSQQTGLPSVSRTLILLDDNQAFTGNQLEAIVSFDTGPVSHSLLTGIELARFSDAYTLDPALLPDIDLINPVETAAGPPLLIPGASAAGDSRNNIVAPYFIDQMTVSDHVQLLVGTRIDFLDFEDTLTDTARDDTKASPLIGAVISPTESSSFYVQVSQSFAPASNRIVGERQPEESRQVEAGFRRKFDPAKTRLTGAVYHLKRKNIAIPDDNGFTQQRGDQRARGIELELTTAPRPGLRGVLSYAYNDAELTSFSEQLLNFFVFPPVFVTLDRSGNRPAFAPEQVLNFWISKRFENGFGIAGGGRFVSEQFIAEDNAFAIDNVFTLDASVFYSLGDARFRLNFKNLTDREYFQRGFGAASVIPAPPFTVYFGVDLRLGQ